MDGENNKFGATGLIRTDSERLFKNRASTIWATVAL
jgi:hypothetical protein